MHHVIQPLVMMTKTMINVVKRKSSSMVFLRLLLFVSLVCSVSLHAADVYEATDAQTTLEHKLACLDKRIANAAKQDTWLNSTLHLIKKLPVPLVLYIILTAQKKNKIWGIDQTIYMVLLVWAFDLLESSPQHQKIEELLAQKDLLLEQTC